MLPAVRVRHSPAVGARRHGASPPAHLRDVQDVAQLRKVGRHVLAAGEGEEFVVLHERVHQPAGRAMPQGAQQLAGWPNDAKGGATVLQMQQAP